MATPPVTRKRTKAAQLPTYDVRQFTHLKDRAELITEGSSLGLTAGQTPGPEFIITSPTGKSFTFRVPVTLVAYKDTPEEEVLGWQFNAASPLCPIRLVVILND